MKQERDLVLEQIMPILFAVVLSPVTFASKGDKEIIIIKKSSSQGILQHDLSLMPVIHSMLSLSRYSQASHLILSNIWKSLTVCTDLWSEDYAEVPSCLYHFQNVSRNVLFPLTACEVTYNIYSSLYLRQNSIGYLWNDSVFCIYSYHTLVNWDLLYILRLNSKMLGSAQVECWREEWDGLGQLARQQSKCWE